jgi:hypothetical protein
MNVGGDGRFWGADQGVLFATEGGAGYFMTELEYADFELKLEYRVPPRGTSGIAIRSPLQGDPAYDGLTIVLADDDQRRQLSSDRSTGALYDLTPPSNHAAKPHGAWSRVHIIAQGKQITVKVNGTEVLDANLDKYRDRFAAHPGLLRTRGHIGLQSGRGSVEFRGLYIRSARRQLFVSGFNPCRATFRRDDGPARRCRGGLPGTLPDSHLATSTNAVNRPMAWQRA